MVPRFELSFPLEPAAADPLLLKFYPVCFQIRVYDGVGTTIPEGVSFPGEYSFNDPGMAILAVLFGLLIVVRNQFRRIQTL